MISYDDIKSGKAVMPVSVAPAVTKEIGALPAMVQAAAAKLASATTAAEVLDAKDAAGLVYDASKRAARMAKAKKAHDDLIAAAHRAQADALDIEAAARRRLADEYDGGQERGEIVGPKGGGDTTVPARNAATAAEIGITRKEVHEARRVRNAEQAQPGVVREALDKALDEGKEPSRAVVNEAVAKALGEAKQIDARTDVEREADAMVLAWDKGRPDSRSMFLDYLRFVGFTITESNQATGMGGEDVDRSASRASSAVQLGATNSPERANPLDGGAFVAVKGKARLTNADSVEPSLSNAHSVPASSQATEQTGAVPVIPAAPVAPFNNPRCQHPETCHLAHSRDECFNCNVAWSKRPRDEQVRLWTEANEAARAAI